MELHIPEVDNPVALLIYNQLVAADLNQTKGLRCPWFSEFTLGFEVLKQETYNVPNGLCQCMQMYQIIKIPVIG